MTHLCRARLNPWYAQKSTGKLLYWSRVVILSLSPTCTKNGHAKSWGQEARESRRAATFSRG